MTWRQNRDAARHRRRLAALADTRRRLRTALAELMPGHRVIVFGSLTKPGVFNARSDVDLALVGPSVALDPLKLTSELMERLARPVDVVVLDQCRFREKIRREGELWTT
jgi:predicted nucleotidyltransferase